MKYKIVECDGECIQIAVYAYSRMITYKVYKRGLFGIGWVKCFNNHVITSVASAERMIRDVEAHPISEKVVKYL